MFHAPFGRWFQRGLWHKVSSFPSATRASIRSVGQSYKALKFVFSLPPEPTAASPISGAARKSLLNWCVARAVNDDRTKTLWKGKTVRPPNRKVIDVSCQADELGVGTGWDEKMPSPHRRWPHASNNGVRTGPNQSRRHPRLGRFVSKTGRAAVLPIEFTKPSGLTVARIRAAGEIFAANCGQFTVPRRCVFSFDMAWTGWRGIPVARLIGSTFLAHDLAAQLLNWIRLCLLACLLGSNICCNDAFDRNCRGFARLIMAFLVRLDWRFGVLLRLQLGMKME